jgi:hypothetical protein
MESAVILIQYHYRKHLYKDTFCCISYEKVKFPCFMYRTPIGKYVFYDYLSLNEYFKVSHKKIDPLTRIPYSIFDIQRFNKGLEKYFGIKTFDDFEFKRAFDQEFLERNSTTYNFLRITNGFGGLAYTN